VSVLVHLDFFMYIIMYILCQIERISWGITKVEHYAKSVLNFVLLMLLNIVLVVLWDK
jgi:hypothetical protein